MVKTAAEGADWERMNRFEYEMSTQKLCDIIADFCSQYKMDDDVEKKLSEEYHVAFSAWAISSVDLTDFLESGKVKHPSNLVKKRIELLEKDAGSSRYRDWRLSAKHLSEIIGKACDSVRSESKNEDDQWLEDIDEYLWNTIAPKYVAEACDVMKSLDYFKARDPVSLTFSKWRHIQRLRGASSGRRSSKSGSSGRSKSRSRSRSGGRRRSKSSRRENQTR